MQTQAKAGSYIFDGAVDLRQLAGMNLSGVHLHFNGAMSISDLVHLDLRGATIVFGNAMQAAGPPGHVQTTTSSISMNPTISNQADQQSNHWPWPSVSRDIRTVSMIHTVSAGQASVDDISTRTAQRMEACIQDLPEEGEIVETGKASGYEIRAVSVKQLDMNIPNNMCEKKASEVQSSSRKRKASVSFDGFRRVRRQLDPATHHIGSHETSPQECQTHGEQAIPRAPSDPAAMCGVLDVELTRAKREYLLAEHTLRLQRARFGHASPATIEAVLLGGNRLKILYSQEATVHTKSTLVNHKS